MESIWENIKSELQNTIPAHSYRMWIEPVKYVKNDSRSVVLSCANAYFRKRLLDQYGSAIISEFERATGRKHGLKIEINAAESSSLPLKNKESSRMKKVNLASCRAAIEKRTKAEPRQLSLPGTDSIRLQSGRLLRKNFTFDRFVVGGSNDFAYSAAQSIAVGTQSVNNALFLLSDTGMGKSHLSQAVGHQILAQRPNDRVYYITAEDFTNEMVASFKNNSVNEFKERYRTQCDVLLLEDTHFLTGKDATQKELALTLDYLFESDKKIIFSGCYLPDEIPKMNDQLKSRLSSGLITNIEVPDYKTRVKILRKKCREESAQVPGDILEYLAGELAENVRQLESGLMSVLAKSSLLGAPIDVDLAHSVIKNIARRKKAITLDVIKKLVCDQYNVTREMLESKSRKQSVVRPRQMAIYLSRKYTDQPLKVIGKSFNRYHATALHSINAVERSIKDKGPVTQQLDFLTRKLESGSFSA